MHLKKNHYGYVEIGLTRCGKEEIFFCLKGQGHEIFAAQGAPPVSLTQLANGKNLQSKVSLLSFVQGSRVSK
jgi:hypothetical protein